MFKKIGTALAGLMLTASLVACGGEAEPQPAQPTVTVTESPTAEPETSEPDAYSREEAFIAVVRENQPVLDSIPDYELVSFAETACNAFDNGASLEDVFAAIVGNTSNGVMQEAMAFTIGAGVSAFCPQHEGLIEGGVGT